MPIKVAELKEGKEKNSLRGKLLEFLKKNSDLAYTLKEIYTFFKEEKTIIGVYESKQDILYKLIYNYLRDFVLQGLVVHKGNYYHFKKEALNEKKK